MMETSFLPIRPVPPAAAAPRRATAAVVRRVRRCRADKARAFIAPGCQVSSCALWRTEYSPQWGQICFEVFLLSICVYISRISLIRSFHDK